MFIIGVCSSARRRRRGVFHAQPLKEHGRDASASVEESAKSFAPSVSQLIEEDISSKRESKATSPSVAHGTTASLRIS